MVNKGHSQTWIGLSDQNEEGKFTWESGPHLSPKMAANWSAWSPDNYEGNEDCVIISLGTHLSKHKMVDVPCTIKSPFVCQKLIPGDLQYVLYVPSEADCLSFNFYLCS